MIIYKIFRKDEFIEFTKTGTSNGSPQDEADRFIHFSTKAQLTSTLKKHFDGEENLILMAIDSESINKKLRWEESRQNELFPHLYSNLVFSNALWFAPIQFVENRHIIPLKVLRHHK